jgi:hypothetical protein
MLSEEKIRKIAALAQNGSAGEKQNAQAILDKAGVTTEQLLELLSQQELVAFPYKTKNEFSIIIQAVCRVLNESSLNIIRRPRKVMIEIPSHRTAECLRASKTMLGLYRKELKTFVKAFIVKNRLWPEIEPDSEPTEFLSQSELDEIMNMAAFIKTASWERQLTGKTERG